MIRVLIAEDSAVTREYLRWLIDDAEGLEVAGVANDGQQAVELAERLKPDVILMDVHMPQMDGFQATRLIMERHPTPIVMATASSSKAETRGAFEALDAGALILLDKPPAPWDPGHDEAAGELLRAVKLMAEVKVVRRWAPRPTPQEPPRFPRVRDPRVIAIGASTGGPQVLVGDPRRAPRPAQRPAAARPAHLRGLHRGLRRLARHPHADGGGAGRARRGAAAGHDPRRAAPIATWASRATAASRSTPARR